MRTYLDELLEMETSTKPKSSCSCGCPACSGKSEMEWDEFAYEDELSSSQASSAVAYNRDKATSLGWGNHRFDILEKVLRLNYSPTEEAFAGLVAQWQASKGLTADGKLGPGTWEAMKPIIGLSTSMTSPQVSTSYQRVFPMPELPDGRRPTISSGHHSVNPSRSPRPNPNNPSREQCQSYLWWNGKCHSDPGYHGHQGADIMYRYKQETDPPGPELRKKKRIDGKYKYWTPESVWALAYGPGVVQEVREQYNGWTLKIIHPDGIQSRYLHLTKPIVQKGSVVQAGDRLAQLDKRGDPAHLHFEIRLKGRHHYMDSVNPAPFLQNIPFKRL